MFLTLAGESHAWSDDRRLRDQIAQYHVFMDEHPKASTQIRENPQLVYDGKFLKSHPEVERFLKARPELREEIAQTSGTSLWMDMIATIIAMAATTVMIGALDGGAIRTENNATLKPPGHRGGPKANNLWAAALF